jgi:hypothetical protein
MNQPKAPNRANPFRFENGFGGSNAVDFIPVATGDAIMLEIARTSTFGDFVGEKIRVAQVLPAPTTLNTNTWFAQAPGFFSSSNRNTASTIRLWPGSRREPIV